MWRMGVEGEEGVELGNMVEMESLGWVREWGDEFGFKVLNFSFLLVS